MSRIVNFLESNASARDDLMQEALFHAWREAERRPEQSIAWYLRGCRFHLQHVMTAGRSIDSSKRRNGAARDEASTGLAEEALEVADPAADVIGEVCAREMVRMLHSRLLPRQGFILERLVEGYGPSEVSRTLHISHPAISKLRRKLAIALALLQPDSDFAPAGALVVERGAGWSGDGYVRDVSNVYGGGRHGVDHHPGRGAMRTDTESGLPPARQKARTACSC